MAIENDYFIIEYTDKTDLTNAVHKWLQQGCKLVGGISIAYNSNLNTMYYAQAMIGNKVSKPITE